MTKSSLSSISLVLFVVFAEGTVAAETSLTGVTADPPSVRLSGPNACYSLLIQGKTADGRLNGTGPDPPPEEGTQPRCGRKLGPFGELPVYVALKRAARLVVTPGLTGLPIFPENSTSIARSVSSVSRPPTR